MLHVLPVEISLAVLSYLPISTLCPLSSLSRKWFDFFSENQSVIFHNAAVFHGYTHPGTLLLEDALSVHKGSPWEGATDWKDFCKLTPHWQRLILALWARFSSL
jgi:F-box-like